jgi:protein-disulfide isomerase
MNESNPISTNSNQDKKNPTSLLIMILLISQVLLQGTILWRLLALERQLANSGSFAVRNSGNGAVTSVESSPIVKDVDVGLNPPRGDIDASITIIEFSDFNCPYCKQSAQVLEELIANNPRKIKLYYRHAVPMAKTDSFRAALASECAGEQGKFWEMHDALFEAAPDLSDNKLMNIAKTLKLDDREFSICLSTSKFKDRVLSDFDEAQRLGLLGTPTFFINGQMVIGSQPIERWHELLGLPNP